MEFAGRFFRLALTALLAGAALVRADEVSARIVILANSDDAASIRLARYYAEQRSVPVANIFAFKMPATETITWPEFVASIWQPLQEELVRLKRIDAITMDLSDETGRRKRAPHGHDISYLVVCRGVPLRISHAPEFYKEELPVTSRAEFRTNQAAVDSELALLAQGAPPINGFVANPLFRNDHPTTLQKDQVIKVSRLDGPTYEDARALVDHALAAVRDGLIGRAYVDIGGINPDGDLWLESVATQLGRQGFPLEVDRDPSTLSAAARFDAPAVYFGWYARDLNGPMALPGFRFPPGAVALHIHSYSAHTLHSASEGWCGPLVARGVTATVGNVFEPYLQLTHIPDLLWRALASGATFGDAAAYATPTLSWQGVAIGDPLYRPFAVPLEKQLQTGEHLSSRQVGYVVLHQAQLLEAEAKQEEALELLRRTMAERPSLALAEALALRLERAGDSNGAVKTLGFADRLEKFEPDEWALVRQMALRLQALGARGPALKLWRTLLAEPVLPRELRLAWLEDARKAALAAGNTEQAETWGKELSGLSAVR